MSRRYAILDDNQQLLERRLAELQRRLPALVRERLCAAMVIGSVADGLARDSSDIDLVCVLDRGDPHRADYRWWDEEVQPLLHVHAGDRYPVQPVIIARRSLATAEPHLRRALAGGIPLWDPEGLFHDQSEPRA